MTPEIGNIFLIFAFSISVLSFLSATYSYYADAQIYDLSKNIYLIFFLLLASFFVLEFSFLTDDFSVLYVANNSNPNLPAYYKFSALWGGHEGSLLLFVLIISIWFPNLALIPSFFIAFLMLCAQYAHFSVKNSFTKFLPSFFLLCLSLTIGLYELEFF